MTFRAIHFRRLIPAVFIASIALFVSIAFTSGTAFAHGTESQAITVSPASTEVVASPGKASVQTFEVINGGHHAFNVTLSTAPYYVSGENYDPRFTQLPGTVNASQWVRLSTTTGTVEGDTALSVPYTVEVPSGTPAGGYYAVIFAETSKDEEETGVVSHSRVGNILYITVNGDVQNSGSVTGNALPAFSFIGSIPLSTKISNSGGVHFVTKAEYKVIDMTGKTVFSATTERYVLPQTERTITSSWTPQSLFGIYTVKRSATVAGVVTPIKDEKIIIINPWLFVGLAFLIGIIIGIPVQRARRERHSSKDQ